MVVVEALAWLTQYSELLAWPVVAAFLAGAVLDLTDGHRGWARRVTVAAWALFALFWLSMFYHFTFEQKSIVEGVGVLIAIPGSLWVGYHLATGRDSLFVLSRAVAVMGLVYLPFGTIPFLRQFLVETVASQTAVLMSAIGFEPTVINNAAVPGTDYQSYRSTFLYFPTSDHSVTYTIVLACTGIGSMAIFVGLIAAVRAPFDRKLRALAVSIPVIYVLNLFRNVFIGITFGHQYLDVFPNLVMALFATDDPYKVSYYVADRIIAQGLSVVALVVITWLVVRELPEVLRIVEDVLYLLTGSEWDLGSALGMTPVRTDGE